MNRDRLYKAKFAELFSFVTVTLTTTMFNGFTKDCKRILNIFLIKNFHILLEFDKEPVFSKCCDIYYVLKTQTSRRAVHRPCQSPIVMSFDKHLSIWPSVG